MITRRGFFGLAGAAVAGIALEQAIPNGRVWSFPSRITMPVAGPTLYGLSGLEIGDVILIDMGMTLPPQNYIITEIVNRSQVRTRPFESIFGGPLGLRRI